MIQARFYFTSITFISFAILTVFSLVNLRFLSPNEIIQGWGFIQVSQLCLGIIAGPFSPIIFGGGLFYLGHNLLLRTIINFSGIITDAFYPSKISKMVTFMAIFIWYFQGLLYTFAGV